MWDLFSLHILPYDLGFAIYKLQLVEMSNFMANFRHMENRVLLESFIRQILLLLPEGFENSEHG